MFQFKFSAGFIASVHTMVFQNMVYNRVYIPKDSWQWWLQVYITILCFRREYPRYCIMIPILFFPLHSTYLPLNFPKSLGIWPQTCGFLLQLIDCSCEQVIQTPNICSWQLSPLVTSRTCHHTNCSNSISYKLKFVTSITPSNFSNLFSGHYPILLGSPVHWLSYFYLLITFFSLSLWVRLHDPEFL